PQKPCLLRESLHCVRKPRAFKRGLFRCRWPNSMTKMQLTMQTMCLQLKPAAAVVPHFRQEVENDR
ncbi:hypothetical protein, partial [uncultured Duodenibacillus sp.]